MKKKLEYKESSTKTDDGLPWFKSLLDENGKEIYNEINFFKEITFQI